MKRKKTTLAALVVIAGAPGAGLPLTAAAEVAIEEVVVTARKRAESLQDIPDAVTAFSAFELKNRGVTDLGDISGTLPNFIVRESQQPGVVFLSMRGVANQRFQEPPVAIVVDGVQLTSEYQIIQALENIQQIEVLRGPQGSLYGRNAIGGAIIINTKQPTEEISGDISGHYGEGDDLRFSGSLSGALVPDMLYGGLAGSYQDFDGVLENEHLDSKADFEEVKFLRGRLLFTPTDRLSLDLRSSWEQRDAGAAYFVNIPSGDINEIRPINSGTEGRNTRDIFDVSAQLKYVFDFAELQITVGHSRLDDDFLQDIDFEPISAIDATQGVDVDSFSSEVRLSSRSDQRLRWMIGGYYADIDQFVRTLLHFNTCFFVNPATCPPGPVVPPASVTIPFGINDNNNEIYAVFGQINYDLLDNTELTIGLRYDNDKRTQTDQVTLVTRQDTFDDLQPKFSLAHRWNDQAMSYVTVSRGFRSGAFNGTDFITRRYDQETLWNYEIGGKLDLMDRRLRLNGAVFYVDYTDRQEYVIQGGTGSQTLFNIPDSRIYGMELEGTVLIGEHTTVSLGAGYLDTKVQESNAAAEAALIAFNGLAPGSSFEGNELPNVPAVTLSFGLQHERQLLAGIGMLARVDVSHHDGVRWSLLNENDSQDAVTLVNGRLAFAWERFEFAVTAENLFSEDYYTESASPGFGSINPIPGGFPARGRRVGGQLSYRF